MLSVLVFLPLLAAAAAAGAVGARPVGAVGLRGRDRRRGGPGRACCGPATRTPGRARLAFEQQVTWIPGIGASYHVGLDGLSLALVVMTTVVFVACAVFALGDEQRPRLQAALFLALETTCLGVFAAADLIVFFVFFDLSIVGMYFVDPRLGPRRPRALGAAVLPLHLPRLPGAAARLHRALRRLRPAHLRHGRRWRPPRRCRARGATGVLVLGAVLLGLAVKTPDRALPHLAAAGPHRRARDRLGGAGRRDAQAGHLRVRPDRDADAPRGLARLGAGAGRSSASSRCCGARWWRWPRAT